MSDEHILFTLADFAPTRTRGTWLDGRIAHLSASSLGMFRRCPRQWQQRYLKGRKEPPGEGLIIGNFFHETVNHNYATKITSHEDKPLSELVEYLEDKAIPKVVNAAGGVNEIRWDEGSGLEKSRSDSRRVVSAYHQQVLPRMQPVATEQRMEWHIQGLPVPLIGFLDTILADRIVDTKTGKQSRSKLKPDWHLQADIYASYIGRPIEYHSISRAAKITTSLESPDLLVSPSAAQAQNLIGVIQKMTEQIQHMYDTYGPDGDWPTWGRYADWTMNLLPCNFCGYRKDCPAWA